jgi:hypothetical protein
VQREGTNIGRESSDFTTTSISGVSIGFVTGRKSVGQNRGEGAVSSNISRKYNARSFTADEKERLAVATISRELTAPPYQSSSKQSLFGLKHKSMSLACVMCHFVTKQNRLANCHFDIFNWNNCFRSHDTASFGNGQFVLSQCYTSMRSTHTNRISLHILPNNGNRSMD